MGFVVHPHISVQAEKILRKFGLAQRFHYKTGFEASLIVRLQNTRKTLSYSPQ